jgi:glucose-1-phosphate adenylyltransferase
MGVGLDSVVSGGCIISGGRVQRSILGYNVRINSYVKVEDSLLFDRVDVGRYCRIRNTIIDKDVQVPPRMEIGYDLDEDKKQFMVTDSGIVVISKGTIIKSPSAKFWMGTIQQTGLKS